MLKRYVGVSSPKVATQNGVRIGESTLDSPATCLHVSVAAIFELVTVWLPIGLSPYFLFVLAALRRSFSTN